MNIIIQLEINTILNFVQVCRGLGQAEASKQVDSWPTGN